MFEFLANSMAYFIVNATAHNILAHSAVCHQWMIDWLVGWLGFMSYQPL